MIGSQTREGVDQRRVRPDGGGDAGAEPGQPLLEQARRDGVRGDEDVALAVGAEVRDDVGDLRGTAEDERGTDGNACVMLSAPVRSGWSE